MVFGEITTKAPLDYDKIVRETCKGIGYDVYEEDLASACIFAVSGVFLNVVDECCAKQGAGPLDGGVLEIVTRYYECSGSGCNPPARELFFVFIRRVGP